MTDFQSGFSFGVAIGLGVAALWIVFAPRRYVATLDRATFKYVWLRLAVRARLARLFGREPSAAERDAAAILRARVDSAIARRNDPQVETDARRMGIAILVCCAVTAVWPPALVALASIAILAIAIFVLRLERRSPDGASRRAASPSEPAIDGGLGGRIQLALRARSAS